MPRAIWKGAITFGLVHIPVALYPASRQERLDFDWLDRRNMKPVGYKRVNKGTGKEVPREDIVRGLQYEEGRYVVLTDEEIRAANVKSTQTIDIHVFVDAREIAHQYFSTPYHLAPTQRGEKVYALLRETLKRTGKVGVATVVIQTNQHLAALVPCGRALLLNTLRWASEVRSVDELDLPEESEKGVRLQQRERSMAQQLVEDMSGEWDPAQYHDTFRDDVLAQAEHKIRAGKTHAVPATTTPGATGESAQIIDLTELLKRSLRGREKGGKAAGGQSETHRNAAAETRRSSHRTAPATAKRKRA